MPIVQKQSLAEEDLIDIWLYSFDNWLYSFDNWGDEQADKYLDDLEATFNLLSETPFICRERDEFIPPVRIYHYAHHLIVYIPIEKRHQRCACPP
jgi:toxin ParE1/3/4